MKEEMLTKDKKKVKIQLAKLLDDKTPSLEMISAFAGDRELSAEETTLLRKLKKERGKEFFSDILFVLTHQHYSPKDAMKLWNAIIQHNHQISEKLGRNFGIAASALDYLSNIRDQLESPVVISEPKITTIADVALKDELTHLFDYSTFLSKLETEITRYKRYRTEFSLIMIDIDDFKLINDTYGHQEGDKILGQLSSTMLEVTRGLDICARYGGEEFAVILPQTGSAKASALAERLRKRAAHKLKRRKVTISLGVATCPKDAKSAKSLIKKADTALYNSKRKGKNCITVF